VFTRVHIAKINSLKFADVVDLLATNNNNIVYNKCWIGYSLKEKCVVHINQGNTNLLGITIARRTYEEEWERQTESNGDSS